MYADHADAAKLGVVPQNEAYSDGTIKGIAVTVKEVYKVMQPDNATDAQEGVKRCLFADFAHTYGAGIEVRMYYPGQGTMEQTVATVVDPQT